MQTIGVGDTVLGRCPACSNTAQRIAYDAGSGPELSCSLCEWCWGANGQPLMPITMQTVFDQLSPEQQEQMKKFM